MNIETNSIGQGKGCARNQQTTQFCAEAVSLLKELDAARAETFAARLRTNEAMRDRDNAIKQRDEARACLREVLQNSEFSEWVGVTIWHRWRKAAGLDAGEAK